ncbi:MAG: zinc ribbon domain-containing protein [Candidatus Thermoplasmatota archaeon]|nr:zinc ribbon domain-containing protein [Candidatus Thermoplasmatota archaeon]
MKCSKCEAENPKGQKFCGACGNALPAPAPAAPSHVTAREKALVAVICILVVVLVVVLAIGQIGPKPAIKMVSWDYETLAYWGPESYVKVTFSVTVMNEGDAVGNATIRGSAQVGNQTGYASLAISLSPGEA